MSCYLPVNVSVSDKCLDFKTRALFATVPLSFIRKRRENIYDNGVKKEYCNMLVFPLHTIYKQAQ